MGGAHHCSGPPVSEMTYTVLNGTLNSSIPYHTFVRWPATQDDALKHVSRGSVGPSVECWNRERTKLFCILYLLFEMHYE